MKEIGESADPDSVKRVRYGQLFETLDAKMNHYRDSLAQADVNSVVALFLYYQSLQLLKYDEIDRALEKLSYRSRTLPAETFQKKYGQIQEDAKVLARHILREKVRIRREPSVAERSRVVNHKEQVATPTTPKRPSSKTVKPKL